MWHTCHLNGFSTQWILLCLVWFPACVNRLPQTKDSNGFSPMSCQVWIFSKTFSTFAALVWFRPTVKFAVTPIRPCACVNRLPQTEHWNSFFPEWIFLCSVKFELCRKDLPHSWHLYGFCPLHGILPCSVKTVSITCESVMLAEMFGAEWLYSKIHNSSHRSSTSSVAEHTGTLILSCSCFSDLICHVM